MIKSIFLIILLGLLFSDEIYLIDGSILKGKIINESKKTISLSINVGDSSQQVISIDRLQVEKIIYDDIKSNSTEYLYNDPNKSRYFFAPSAYSIGKNETYFRDTWVFFPSFGYGLSNNFSIEGGMSIFPGAGIENQLKLLSLKYSSNKIVNEAQFAGGVFYLGNFEGGVGFVFATATKGDIDNNLSLSTGLSYFKDGSDLEFSTNPTLVLCGKRRLDKNISFVFENWFSTSDSPLLMNFGIRFFGRNLTVDLSGFTTSDAVLHGDFFLFPMVDFSYHF